MFSPFVHLTFSRLIPALFFSQIILVLIPIHSHSFSARPRSGDENHLCFDPSERYRTIYCQLLLYSRSLLENVVTRFQLDERFGCKEGLVESNFPPQFYARQESKEDVRKFHPIHSPRRSFLFHHGRFRTPIRCAAQPNWVNDFT